MTVTADRIRALLRDRYSLGDGWLFMEEVTPPSADPGAKGRRFDAIALTLWASSAVHVIGFEIKVTKADWRRELAQPAKAGELMRWCDGYFLVCPPEVAGPDDLRAGWGLIHATDEGLRQKRAAPALQPVERGLAFWRCMLLRSAQRPPRTPEEVGNAWREGYEKGLEQGKDEAARDVKHAESRLQQLREQIATFEKAAGFSVAGPWQYPEKVGRIVRALAQRNVDSLASDLHRAAERAKVAADDLAALLAAPAAESEDDP